MTTILFVNANVKQLRTDGSFRILLRFFRTSWGVGVLNSAIFTSFTIGLSVTRFWRAFGISGGGVGVQPPTPTRNSGTPLIQRNMRVVALGKLNIQHSYTYNICIESGIIGSFLVSLNPENDSETLPVQSDRLKDMQHFKHELIKN